MTRDPTSFPRSADAPKTPASGKGRRFEPMEIGLNRGRRIMGFVGWLVLLLVVAAALTWLFVQFTASLRLALLLVIFMVGYMLIMGWIAQGKLDQRRDPIAEDDDV